MYVAYINHNHEKLYSIYLKKKKKNCIVTYLTMIFVFPQSHQFHILKFYMLCLDIVVLFIFPIVFVCFSQYFNVSLLVTIKGHRTSYMLSFFCHIIDKFNT